MKSPEYVSSDILENNLVMAFRPLQIAQKLFGCHRIEIKSHFASPVSKFHKLYTVVWVVTMAVAETFSQIMLYSTYYVESRHMYFSTAFGLSMFLLSYNLGMANVRFFGVDQSILLFATLQKIDRLLKVQNQKHLFNKIYYRALFVVCCVIFGNVVSLFIYMSTGELKVYAILNLGYVIFILDVTYNNCLIYYLTLRLDIIKRGLDAEVLDQKNLDNLTIDWPGIHVPTVTITESFKNNPTSTDDCKSTAYYNCLKLILEAFKLINHIYRFHTFLLVVACTGAPLSFVESIVVGRGYKNEMSRYVFSVAVVWIGLYYVGVIVTAYNCDHFKRRIKQIEQCCIKILTIHKGGDLRDTAQKILYTIQWQPPRYTVYDIFEMDRNFPLRFVQFVTDYIIILIQLTLL